MAERIIGKAVTDSKFHVLEKHLGIWKRVCTWQIIQYPPDIIKGDKVTCENCLVRQYDGEWE